MVFDVILDPHTIIKQPGMMEHATSNTAGQRTAVRYRYDYEGVNEVFTAEITGQNG